MDVFKPLDLSGDAQKSSIESVERVRCLIIGSGPAGLYAAKELNDKCHNVTVYEKDEKVGGFLRYGIPDFKLEKNVIDRRLKILEEEGIVFKTGIVKIEE